MKKSYSFDIFDTCLIRKCGTPQKVLDILSDKVFNSSVDIQVKEEFAYFRSYAADTLHKIKSGVYSLDDIYDNIEWCHPALKSKQELIEIEKECEEILLVPVYERLQQIQELHSRGEHIIFISDMYLPSTFLKNVLRKKGFFVEGDSIYVSCEYGATKSSGRLFQLIQESQKIEYSNWEHWGDDILSDYKVPKALGIKTHLITYKFSRYEASWFNKDCSLHISTQQLMASLSKAIRYTSNTDSHMYMIADIVAPFLTTLAYRILKKAREDEMRRLYFCARDTYQLFIVAQKLQKFFPEVECVWFYTSRKALKESDNYIQLEYFKQIGLASKDKVGIVDMRSQGWTLSFINDFLNCNGYASVKGYYYQMYSFAGIHKYKNLDYYSEWGEPYLVLSQGGNKLPNIYSKSWIIYETFFAINGLLRTIGYESKNGKIIPVLSDIDNDNDSSWIENAAYWQKRTSDILTRYVEWFCDLGLQSYVDEIWKYNVQLTLFSFLDKPYKEYTSALECLYSFSSSLNKHVRFVGKLTFWDFFRRNGTRQNIWRRATIVNSIPTWLTDIAYFFR